jgi:hypothetical protein
VKEHRRRDGYWRVYHLAHTLELDSLVKDIVQMLSAVILLQRAREKLRKIARALDVPFKVLEEMLLESRLEVLGIREPELLSLFKDIPSLPEKDKRAIINAYLKVKERRMRKKKT